jgi:hypothetical protein
MGKQERIEDQIEIMCVFNGTPDGQHSHQPYFFCYSHGMEQFERPDLMVTDIPAFS